MSLYEMTESMKIVCLSVIRLEKEQVFPVQSQIQSQLETPYCLESQRHHYIKIEYTTMLVFSDCHNK